MSYLDKLRQKIGEGAGGEVPTKPAKGASAAFAGSPGRVCAPKLDAGLPNKDSPVSDPSETSGHWLILQAERQERWFSPPVTRAELEARYPGAVLISLPETSGTARPATAQEAAELRKLVTAVAAQEGFSEEERVEALANALRDAANALRCFRALLNEGRKIEKVK
jgi:hypothetical protein